VRSALRGIWSSGDAPSSLTLIIILRAVGAARVWSSGGTPSSLTLILYYAPLALRAGLVQRRRAVGAARDLVQRRRSFVACCAPSALRVCGE